MNVEHLAAQKAPETLKNFVAGRWVASSSGESLVIPNPATEQILAHVPLSNAADVDAAVAGARAAAHEWGEMPPPERATYLFKLREALLDNRDALTKLVTTENGKVYSDAAGEVRRGIEVVDFACGAPTLLMGQNLDQVSRGIDSEMVRFPVGVVAGITPFNFPFMVPMWMLPLAIACGNTFILKPSERTPLSSQRIVELCDEAGIPPGVISLVHGAVETVTGLISHVGVDAVSFVGSERVARIVYETAAKSGKRVQALGGAKNHIIAMPDAVLDQSVPNIAESAFGNAGQRCLAGSVLTLVGEAPGTKAGGKLEQQLFTVGVSALPDKIPTAIEVDISGLGLGAQLKVADVATPDGVEIALPGDALVIQVAVPRGLTGTDAEGEGEAGESAEA